MPGRPALAAQIRAFAARKRALSPFRDPFLTCYRRSAGKRL